MTSSDISDKSRGPADTPATSSAAERSGPLPAEPFPEDLAILAGQSSDAVGTDEAWEQWIDSTGAGAPVEHQPRRRRLGGGAGLFAAAGIAVGGALLAAGTTGSGGSAPSGGAGSAGVRPVPAEAPRAPAAGQPGGPPAGAAAPAGGGAAAGQLGSLSY